MMLQILWIEATLESSNDQPLYQRGNEVYCTPDSALYLTLLFDIKT